MCYLPSFYSISIQGPFTIKEHSIHKKFLSEGKATINLLHQRMKVMVSNCPPEHLKTFLSTLALKLKARGLMQGKKQAITGAEPAHFEDISPLTLRDLDLAKKNRTNITMGTPSRKDALIVKPMKRKLCEIQNNYEEDGSPPDKKPLLLNNSTSLLCEEQLKVIDMVQAGENIFFTGSAGTGKTYLLQKIIKTLPPETTFVTASTGAAACHIGGITLHSFAGIGRGEGTLKQCIDMASKEHKANNWKKCKCLIIDEISMVDGDFFDKLETIARVVRNSSKPFGGIQLVLCGDFLQLPPVSKDDKKLFSFQVSEMNTSTTSLIRTL